MTMRVSSFVILLYFCVSVSTGCGNNMPKSEPADLSWDVESVTFYNVYEFNAVGKISNEELNSLESVKVKDPRLTDLFSKVSFTNDWALWKGAQLATVDLKNGQKIRIKVSNYGHFFSIIGQKGFYFFEHPEDQKLWDYLFFGEGLKKALKESS